MSKNNILTLYLNCAPFGGTLQGIGAVNWAYLGKPSTQLSYGEAALPTVLPQTPSRLRSGRWPQRAQAARNKVLTRMVSQGVWPQRPVQEAIEEPVRLFPRQIPQLAPLFSCQALATSRDEKMTTMLNAGLQWQFEDLALNWKSRLTPRSSLAIVVVDHTDMKVRGWVESADITDDSRPGHIDMVSAVRSPGSVLEPFIYAIAMDGGLIHPTPLLQDVLRRSSDYHLGNFDSGFHGPVNASKALVRSLNLPTVQMLEAYGPKRFATNLRDAGLPLALPADAEPSLLLILGGAEARLEDIIATYSAFTRHGKAARLRLKPDDPLVERSLMSPGTVWTVRRILAGEAQPVPNVPLPQVVPLVWKTGTSYGYRNAWVVGLDTRYLIGTWTGWPDDAPVVGQFGFASAMPLLNQVSSLLLVRQAMSHGGLPVDPHPQTASRGAAYWPSRRDLPADDNSCRRRLASWLLDASQPPTLLLPRQGGVRGIRFPVQRDTAGERVATDCSDTTEVVIDAWPLPPGPWLPARERRRARLGPASKVCPPLQTQNAAPLMLSGIHERALVKHLPDEVRVILPVQTNGGEGRRWWFINGQPLDAAGATTTLMLDRLGEWQLVIMDKTRQIAAVSFTLQ